VSRFGARPAGIIHGVLVVHADAVRKTMRCDVCGYGVSVLFEPAACPMCQTTPWVDKARTAEESARDPLDA
jgi:hypothetical protein